MAPKAARGVCKRPAGGMCKRLAKRSKTGGVSVLSQFLECALTKLSEPQLDRFCQHLQDKFTMSSACTVSGMAEVVHAELTRMLELPSEVAFSCEKVKSKRGFYMSVMSPHLFVHGCMFDDMASLPDLVAQCSVHGHACKVPMRTSLHVCGFSCKDLPKLNNNWSPAQKAMVLQKQLGSRGKAFAALTNFANKAKPNIMIPGNVDELEDKGEPNPNLDFLYEVMSAVGYGMGQKTLVSMDFGLPQGRKRVYFVCIRNESFGLNTLRPGPRGAHSPASGRHAVRDGVHVPLLAAARSPAPSPGARSREVQDGERDGVGVVGHCWLACGARGLVQEQGHRLEAYAAEPAVDEQLVVP